MKSIFPVPLFEHVSIVENREYVKYFDESVNVYNEHFNKTFPFKLEFDYFTYTGKLEICNCGGHVDSVPSSTKQLDWTESALSNLSFDQTWATNWNLLSIESYSMFIEKLIEGEADIKSLYYECDKHNLKTLVSHSLRREMPIRRIFCYDVDNNLSKIDVDDKMNELLNLINFTNTDKQVYDSLIKILKINNWSRTDAFRVDFVN